MKKILIEYLLLVILTNVGLAAIIFLCLYNLQVTGFSVWSSAWENSNAIYNGLKMLFVAFAVGWNIILGVMFYRDYSDKR